MASDTAVEDVQDRRAMFQGTVSTIVRMLMARRGLNQTDLAAEIGYTQPAISDKLKARRKWNIEDLWLLADYFEVDVSIFFEDPEGLLRSRWFAAMSELGRPPSIGTTALAS